MSSLFSSSHCLRVSLRDAIVRISVASLSAARYGVNAIVLGVIGACALLYMPATALAQIPAPSNVHSYTEENGTDEIAFDWSQAPGVSTEFIYSTKYDRADPDGSFSYNDVLLPPNVNWISFNNDPGDRYITVTLISRKNGETSSSTIIHTGHDAPTIYSFYPTFGGRMPPFTAGVGMTMTGQNLWGATFALNGNQIPIVNTDGTSANLVLPPGSASGNLVVSNTFGTTSIPIQVAGQVSPDVGQNPYFQSVTFPAATTVRVTYSLADPQAVAQGRGYYADIGWCTGSSLQFATSCQEYFTNADLNSTLDINVPACGQAVVLRAGVVPSDQGGGYSDARDAMINDPSPLYFTVPCPTVGIRNLRAIAMEDGSGIHLTWQSDLNETLTLTVNGSLAVYPPFPSNRGWVDFLGTARHQDYTFTLQTSSGSSLSTTLNSSSPTVLAIIRDGVVTRIYGWNFGSSQSGSSVNADGVTLSPTFWSETEIDVPNDLAAAQSVQVVVNGYSSPPVSGVPPPPGSGSTSGTVYGFSILKPDGSSGYDAAGNVVAYQDQVNQQWSASYDSLNRLKGASQSILAAGGTSFNVPGAIGVQQYLCWNYDSFGNRTAQVVSNISFADNNTCQPQPSATHDDNVASYDANNRITSGTGLTGISYDASGNLQEDGSYTYKYDGEGHLCAVWRHITGVVTGYLYDAEGTRVAKGTVSSFDCPTISNFTVTSQYIPGPDGQQLTEIDGMDHWVHTNIFAEGSMIATDDSGGRHYQFSDWLGNRRLQVDPNGNVETYYQTAPFGDRLNNQLITTEHLFTGKERDQESGLDFFGARHYASALGRFVSPDPSGLSFADLSNPQMLNLYSYATNSPLVFTDPTGLALQQVCTQGAESSQDSIDEEGNQVVNVNAGVHCQLVDDGTDAKVTSTIAYRPLPQYKTTAFNKPFVKVPDLPSCWAVGAQALWNGVTGTLDPTTSVSGAITDLSSGALTAASVRANIKAELYAASRINTYGGPGLIHAGKSSVYRRMKAFAAELGEAADGAVLIGLDYNLISQWEAEANTPCR